MNLDLSVLNDASGFSPNKSNRMETIVELCNLIDQNMITIPLYQRSLSWTEEKSVSLFNYELFGKAPVAPLSFNLINQINKNEIPQLSVIGRNRVNPVTGTLSVVDGQQRLVTNYKAYINDPSFSNIFLDIRENKFILLRKHKNNSKYQIPVGKLLGKNDHFKESIEDYLSDFYDDAEQKYALSSCLSDVRFKLEHYPFTMHIARDMNENEQVEWFNVLNHAGSRLSQIELKISNLKLHDFDIYKSFVLPYQNYVNKYGFKKLFSPFSVNVSYPIASLNAALEKIIYKRIIKEHHSNYSPIPSDTKENVLLSLSKQELNNITNVTLANLREVLEFIHKNKLEKYINKMQYVMYLTGYFIFVGKNNINKKFLNYWIKNVSFVNKTNGEKRMIFTNLINNKFN